MEGGSAVEDLGAPPESWEVADLDMSRLLLNNNNKDSSSSKPLTQPDLSAAGGGSAASDKVSDDALNQVDQFLREALQNPRERLSILRMEQDVVKFIRDPKQQQLEFQQLPTSYLRLAAHRVAQHYSLQSMVLLDNSLPDGPGSGSSSRIIVHKSSECRLPSIRLADIPISLQSNDSSDLKVAIKQRPQKWSPGTNSSNSNSSKANSAKSVEERKEEYNRARARIFSSSIVSSAPSGGKPDGEPRLQDVPQRGSLVVSKVDEKPASGTPDVNSDRGLIDSSSGSNTTPRARIEQEPVGRYRPTSKVAVLRDRDVDRKDPDYDRSYDRYQQRFDPGFGFSGGGPYTIQPMYAPTVNYNTEFPQLGSGHGPQISTEQPRAISQHIPGQWVGPSNPIGIGYGHPDALMRPFNHNHIGAHSASPIYMHASQYPCQRPGMPFIHPHDYFQPFAQSHQHQPDGSFGFARPR